MNITLSKTAKLLIASVVAIFVFVGLYAYVFVSMRDLVDHADELSVRAEDLLGKDARIDVTLAVLKHAQPTIDKVSSSFIKESKIVEFTRTLEALGPTTHTTLVIESLEPGVGVKGAPVLSLRVKGTGKFKDVLALVALLEDFPARFDWGATRFVRIDNGTVVTTGSPGATPPQKDLWSVETSLRALNFVRE